MNRGVELERLRHENLLLRQAGAVKEEQMKLLKHENRSLQDALKETFSERHNPVWGTGMLDNAVSHHHAAFRWAL